MRLLTASLIILSIISGCRLSMPADDDQSPRYKNIRRPAVAGQFYPSNPEKLKAKIEGFLAGAGKVGPEFAVKAVLAPHAGYDFSGAVAAAAFSALEGRRAGTVVLMCNSHSDYFNGVAVSEAEAWKTPLGLLPMDFELADKVVEADESFQYNPDAHLTDHTLEVQLPFLQTVLEGEFKVLPLVFGNTGDEAHARLARALKDNLGQDDIVVVSTDLSHYPAYEDANDIDRQTLGHIKDNDLPALENHIKKTMQRRVPNEQTLCCGFDGIKTLVELRRIAGWDRAEILAYANSGDAAIGDKSRVVGYGAMAFGPGQADEKPGKPAAAEKAGDLSQGQRSALLDIARRTVEAYARGEGVPEISNNDERLERREGAFVTLRRHGELRGCIGQIVPSAKPLWQVVQDMAAAACSQDNRFTPVAKDELNDLEYEVSVLSAPRRVSDWQEVELGRHGVIVKKGMASGVFLPQVADETGWSKEEFLSQLCFQKAGLAPDCYRDKNTELLVFTAEVFGE